MEYKKIRNTVYIRVDKGENVVQTILSVCRKENIRGGYFQGIGACDTATISTYIPERNDFVDHTISGMIEMISLMGNISIDDKDEPFQHSHAVFSYLKDNGCCCRPFERGTDRLYRRNCADTCGRKNRQSF